MIIATAYVLDLAPVLLAHAPNFVIDIAASAGLFSLPPPAHPLALIGKGQGLGTVLQYVATGNKKHVSTP